MIELYLTYKELEQICDDDHDGFTLIENSVSSEEDDGRELRFVLFKENVTGLEYYFNYVQSEFNIDMSMDLLNHDPKISIRKVDAVPIPKVVVQKVLSPIEQADKDLTDKYNSVKVVPYKKGLVPKEVISDIVKFVNEEKFNMFQLRAKVFPVCIEYGVEESSLWEHIQVTRGVWKKRK